MNTTTNRVRDGSPPPLQLHRGMPVDFADEEVETIDQFAADTLDVTRAFFFLIAAMFAASCIGIGFLVGRYFS